MTTELTTPPGTAAIHPDKLAQDLKVIVSDAGDLLKQASISAREDIAAKRLAVAEKARGLAEASHQFARDQPWAVVGVAAAVGVIVGTLLGRR